MSEHDLLDKPSHKRVTIDDDWLVCHRDKVRMQISPNESNQGRDGASQRTRSSHQDEIAAVTDRRAGADESSKSTQICWGGDEIGITHDYVTAMPGYEMPHLMHQEDEK